MLNIHPQHPHNIKSCQGTSPRDTHKYIFAIIILQMNMQVFKNLFILFN